MLTLNKQDLIELRNQVINDADDPNRVIAAQARAALLIAATIEHSADALVDAQYRLSGQ